LKRKRPNFMQGEPPSWTRGCHHQNDVNGGGKVHNHMRTHGSEGATEPGRDGPRPVGPSRPTWPTPGVGSAPPFLAPEGSSTLKPWRHCHLQGGSHSHREAIHKLERGGRSPEEDRPTRRKHPQVGKKEDTVGSVTMINGAMSSTLMGKSSHLSMGCNRS
jgi:hypothetical protein